MVLLSISCTISILAVAGVHYWLRRNLELSPRLHEVDNDAGPPPPDLQRKRFGGGLQQIGSRTKALASTNYVSNWQSLGPKNVVSVGEPRLGRVNCITADPTNSNKLFVGAASGGVWISLDGGQTWTPRTDNLPVLGVSSIVVDPNNSSVVYMATGDADDSITPSIGVYKSVDGGLSWAPTGLTFAMTDYHLIYRLTIHPTVSGTVYAATDSTIYVTKDAGSTWQQINPQGANNSSNITWYDIKFAPSNSSTLYTIGYGAQFYRSTDSGVTWQQTTVGLPATSAIGRSAMAVTAAEPQSVYLLCSDYSTDALYGIYRSTDGGISFAPLPDGGTVAADFGQQSWYDTCLAASPSNPVKLYAAGVHISQSLNHGSTWQSVGAGTHVDVHDLEFIDGYLYACTDGGVHRTADGGAHWTDLSQSLIIGEIYAISGTEQDAALIYTGEQDNGLNRPDGTQWLNVPLGDCGNSIIDPTSEAIVYATSAYGGFSKTTDGWNSYIELQVTNESCEFVGPPLAIHPTNPGILYAGYQNVWQTSDGGNTWQKISNFGDTNTCSALLVSSSNPAFIYVSRGATLLKTQDGGTTWQDISTGLPLDSYVQVQSITVDPNNSGRLWVALNVGGSNSVYASNNAGGSWTNYSGSLPDVGARTIVYENGSQDALYLGMSIGVYYRNASMSDWQPFMTNLPNVIVDDLKIHYGTRTLRAGTYGRGLWESPLASTSSSHPAFFSGEVPLTNGVYYLRFTNGNYFGYYSYLTDPAYIYHFDLGFEYVFAANDGESGVYLYDFASSDFLYTSATFPFPYLYDFSLQSTLYYYLDTTTPGHYTSNPRYFFDFNTGTIITK